VRLSLSLSLTFCLPQVFPVFSSFLLFLSPVGIWHKIGGENAETEKKRGDRVCAIPANPLAVCLFPLSVLSPFPSIPFHSLFLFSLYVGFSFLIIPGISPPEKSIKKATEIR
jgi:hypothetical protein